MEDNFGIKGFISTSMVDWPGKISAVVFLAGCGFRCPVCHNHRLVLEPESMSDYPLEDVLKSLEERKHWIDGVTVTGGEPTFRKNLSDLLSLLRQNGVKIKLDTNGSNPRMLEEIIASGLVDAVFMDVKAPLTFENYSAAAGVPVNPRVIGRSLEILKSSGLEVVFRTTVVPGLIAEPELVRIVNSLGLVPRFAIQPFRNLSTLDPACSTIEEYSLARLEFMRSCFEIPQPAALQYYQFCVEAVSQVPSAGNLQCRSGNEARIV